jgi:hypothetical protein
VPDGGCRTVTPLQYIISEPDETLVSHTRLALVGALMQRTKLL